MTVHSPGYIPVFVWREVKAEGCYTYQLLPTERALENPPEGMSKAAYGRLRLSWVDTTELLGTPASAAECIHIQ